jgi:serine/threonine protein kinase
VFLLSITQALYINSGTDRIENQEKVIAKSVRHFRLQNERDILVRFQHRTPFIRPLVEEIDECEESKTPPALILRYLDDDALQASIKQRLTRPEVKYVARGVLEALCLLHEEGFVHPGRRTYLCFCPAEGVNKLSTDIKPSNVLLNYSQSNTRFNDVQLADFGSTVPLDSVHAQRGDPIGTPIFRSPEAQMEMKWDTSTDIWSFGTMVRVSSSYALRELQQAD